LLARLAHLVTRFFGSLFARPIDAASVAWVDSILLGGEVQVFAAMPSPDRVEGVAVARRTEEALAGTPAAEDGRWLAAALLHDAGKQCSGFGTIPRATVTAVAMVVGEGRVRSWATGPKSVRARMGQYVAHDDLGAELLRSAGARPEVAAWAAAHHRPARWESTGIPPEVCRALAAADGEPAARESAAD
jgi:hypothetical protein